MKIIIWLRDSFSKFMVSLRAGFSRGGKSGGNPDDGPQSSTAPVPRVPIRPQRSGAAANRVPVLDRETEGRDK